MKSFSAISVFNYSRKSPNDQETEGFKMMSLAFFASVARKPDLFEDMKHQKKQE